MRDQEWKVQSEIWRRKGGLIFENDEGMLFGLFWRKVEIERKSWSNLLNILNFEKDYIEAILITWWNYINFIK